VRGFAFVTMESPQAAQKAIDTLDGEMLDGKSIRVTLDRSRSEWLERAIRPGPRR
jgi:RNA recognition motif-containing protein